MRYFPGLYGLEIAVLTATLLSVDGVNSWAARPVIPGTGTRIDYAGDDFEDTSWDFVHRLPKSSREQDNRLRGPTGYSTNGRWVEGPERGHPDHMKIVPTPPNGLPGSEHCLLVRTLNSGIPGRNSYDVQQDDLIANCLSRLNTSISVSEIPSVVVRVYLPEAEKWENRSGPHFGFRISTSATVTERSSGGFFASRTTTKSEPYWPGLWVHFRSSSSRGVDEDSAYLAYRSPRPGYSLLGHSSRQVWLVDDGNVRNCRRHDSLLCQTGRRRFDRGRPHHIPVSLQL